MLFATALSLCAMMPNVVDDIVRLRDEQGVTEAQFRQTIQARKDMPIELKIRSLGAVNLVYALPKGSDYWSVKQQIILTCNNKETIRGHQYQTEGSRRGARGRPRYELDRRDSSLKAWDQDSR